VLSEEDVDRLYPRGHPVLQHRHLTAEQSRQINARLGYQATQPDDVIAYYDVERESKRPVGETGLVFVEPVSGDLRVITAVDDQRVQRVAVAGAEAAIIAPEFLDQFLDRRAQESFIVAANPQAYAQIPAPLKPLQGREDLSQTIADAVHKALVLAEVVTR